MKQPLIQPNIAREALTSSPYRPLFQQATQWLGRIADTAYDGPAACTPGTLNPAAIIGIERVAIEIAALANNITGGAYDLPGALEALQAIVIRAGTISAVADVEGRRAGMEALKPVGSA